MRVDDRKATTRILDALGDAGIDPFDDEQRERLEIFIRQVILWSGRIHLVGKSDIVRTITHLLIDSWSIYLWARDGRHLEGAGAGDAAVRVADLGSGAGFPGIIWKIADPKLDVTLFERREKTVRFPERAVSLLGMSEIRAEGGEAGLSHEIAPFDVVLSKASGRLPAIADVVAGLLRNGGIYLTAKGGGWKEETALMGSAPLRLLRSKELPAGRGTMLLFRREDEGSDR